MKTLILLSGLAAIASAQTLPISAFSGKSLPLQGPTMGEGAASDSSTYDKNAIISSTFSSVFSSSSKRGVFFEKRNDGDCHALALGAGPTISPDTPDAFLSSTVLAGLANNAQTPANYQQVYQNLQAATSAPMGYLGYDSISAYDPSICSANCDSLSGCFAFNIFFERDPTLDVGPNCTNPASTTVIKCSYWGTCLTPQTATNIGQVDADFNITIAGSNAYVSSLDSFPEDGYTSQYLNNAAINAPTQCGSYITTKTFSDGEPFDPARCAAACQAETEYNIQYLNSRSICRYFDTYVLNSNGVPQGQVCALYTQAWDASYATNTGQTNSDGSQWTISCSYSYSNSTDSGPTGCNSTTTTTSTTSTTSTSSTTTSTTITTTTATTTTTTATIPTTTITTTTKPTTTTTGTATTTTTKPTTTTTTTTTAKAATTTTTTTTTPTTTTTTTTTTKSSSTTTTSTKSSTTTTSVKATTTTTTSTKCTTTTTTAIVKPTTTTFTTSTKSATTTTTTTTTSSTASATCFKIKPTGPSYLPSGCYLGVDSSSGKLSYNTGSATVFSLDNFGRICSTAGDLFSRDILSWANPFYGTVSNNGYSSVTCTITGTSMSCAGWWSASTFWTQKSSNYIVHGNCPGNGWDVCGLQVEWTQCPSSSSSKNWAPIKGNGWGW